MPCLYEYSCKLKLKVNEVKSSSIRSSSVTDRNAELTMVDSYKYLSFHLDEHLTFSLGVDTFGRIGGRALLKCSKLYHAGICTNHLLLCRYTWGLY